MDEAVKASEQKRLKVFLGRRYGMSPESRESLQAKVAELEWTGTCRRCHAKLKGTIEECRAHKCEVSE